MDIKKSLKDVVVLVVICAVFGTALAYVNSIVAPIIADRLAGAANDAYNEVMEGAQGFETVNLEEYQVPATIKEAVRETSGLGYAFKIETSGYGSGMILIIGVSNDGVVTGATCIASNETNGLENSYGANLIGKDIEGVKAVDTVAGSTMTTKAYRDAVVDAINAVSALKGEEVDFRTPEEIFQDNLAAALPAAEAKFTRMFMVEIVTGIDSIYVADNGTGYVYVIGETFIGVDAEGNIISDASDDVKSVITTAHTLISSTEYTEIDLTAFEGIHARVLSVKKTLTGNYVVELKCDGFGIHGDHYYGPSGKDFFVMISLSAEGKVIDAITTEETETPTIGGAQLADGKFNSNFIGKDYEESGKVDVVANCTLTTNAFKKAVLRAFEAVTIIEGGAENE